MGSNCPMKYSVLSICTIIDKITELAPIAMSLDGFLIQLINRRIRFTLIRDKECLAIFQFLMHQTPV